MTCNTCTCSSVKKKSAPCSIQKTLKWSTKCPSLDLKFHCLPDELISSRPPEGLNSQISYLSIYRLLDSLVVECWHRVREVPGSIPSQGPRHTKDVIKMVLVVHLFSTEHSKGKILALSQELR